MNLPTRILRRIQASLIRNAQPIFILLSGAIAVLAVSSWLRGLPFTADSSWNACINVIGAFLSFTFAANALVRFRGTRDRMALVLAIGFCISGMAEMGVTIQLFRHVADTDFFDRLRGSWMYVRLFLAEAMLLALVSERRSSRGRDNSRFLILSVALMGTAIYVAGNLYILLIGEPRLQANALIPRPWEMLPLVLYLLAAFGFYQRSRDPSSSLDGALIIAVCMNAACHLVLLESSRAMDAPAMLSQILRVSSYAVLLGGTLLDNARLFAQVQKLATSDPLTGLANYRKLVDVLEAEIERSHRTGRMFSVLLLDLDRLKRINDRHGHLTGSRALCRLAETLRVHSRSIDTPARYGGDEFALVLPETGEEPAAHVATRIREQLSLQAERPSISVSIGVAVYPQNGTTAERLLAAADRALYAMKVKGGASRGAETPQQKFTWDSLRKT